MADLTPVTREEMYLDEIADALENGGGGGGAVVYNATITIQKNGTKVDDFTANQRTDKTINITVPTSAADVSALPASTKYAAALSLTINSSTFVMTGQLKDQDGNNLGTAQTIDLPLESVVVGGSYNSQTKKVVLTLQNGNTIEFSVADLVSGLQTELSASNKLNPAYIDYDSTHRAVSDTEKSTWSGKQDALSSSQLSAVNSGIDSTKVAQIETNKNNISIEDVTANFVAKEGYTVTSTSHVYKQGKHIFGVLCVSKDSGNYGSNDKVCRNTVNIPTQPIVNGCYMAAGQWQINGVGYVYMQKGGSAQSGEIAITDSAGTNTHCFINLDYVTD